MSRGTSRSGITFAALLAEARPPRSVDTSCDPIGRRRAEILLPSPQASQISTSRLFFEVRSFLSPTFSCPPESIRKRAQLKHPLAGYSEFAPGSVRVETFATKPRLHRELRHPLERLVPFSD
jgi:hypothetical protein